MPRQNWSRLTVNLEPELADAAKLRAREKRRSFAKYIQTLIEDDLRQAVNEAAPEAAEPPQALYGSKGKKTIPLTKRLEAEGRAALEAKAPAAAKRPAHT